MLEITCATSDEHTCENHVEGSLEADQRVKQLSPSPPRQKTKLNLPLKKQTNIGILLFLNFEAIFFDFLKM